MAGLSAATGSDAALAPLTRANTPPAITRTKAEMLAATAIIVFCDISFLQVFELSVTLTLVNPP